MGTEIVAVKTGKGMMINVLLFMRCDVGVSNRLRSHKISDNNSYVPVATMREELSCVAMEPTHILPVHL